MEEGSQGPIRKAESGSTPSAGRWDTQASSSGLRAGERVGGPTPIPFKPSFEIESQAEGHCGNILDASAKWMEEATTRPLEYAVLEDLDADKVNQLLDDQRGRKTVKKLAYIRNDMV